jgi:4-amino-4-deoxy-L-arabinose transferase-like glycosyltransferase
MMRAAPRIERSRRRRVCLSSVEAASRRGPVLALIGCSAALRLALNSLVGPTVDEAYTVVMARRLSIGYYDHPPLLYWPAGLAARAAGSEAQLVVRLPYVLMFLATTWLVYRLTALLYDEPSGLWAAVALNLTLFFGLSVGSWVLPDGPLLLFSTGAVLCFVHATSPATSRPRLYWLCAGALCGLALLSKYHAALLFVGAGLYLVTAPRGRGWLRGPEPYLAVLVAALVFSPVILWNVTHGWASLRFQAGRAVPIEESEGTPLVDAVLGQAAWMLPWIWLPLLVVLWRSLRRGPRDGGEWLLTCLAVVPIALFLLIAAAGTRGLPHWAAPGYFMAFPLLGRALAQASARQATRVRAWLLCAVVGLALVVAVLVAQVRWGVVDRVSPQLLSRGDPTADVLQWDPVVAQLRAWGYPREGVVIAGATWADAGKLAYALGPEVPVTSVGPDPRGFALLQPQESLAGRDVLLVARRRPEGEARMRFAPYFQHIEPLGTIDVMRGGQPGVAVSVYLCRHLLRAVPPHRGR